jgi:ETC complex I subunit conserved region
METVRRGGIRKPDTTFVWPDNDNQSGFNEPVSSMGRSVFPDGAMARIYRPCRSVMTSANPRKDWRLVFERSAAPFIEPLMGYTAGRDTMSQVELSFPTLQAAIRYAERQGLNYVVQGAPPTSQAKVGVLSEPGTPDAPAMKVVDDPVLSSDEKRAALKNFNKRLINLATADRSPENARPTRLNVVGPAMLAAASRNRARRPKHRPGTLPMAAWSPSPALLARAVD